MKIAVILRALEWALPLLVRWLQERADKGEALADDQRARINEVIYDARSMELFAAKLGCQFGGVQREL